MNTLIIFSALLAVAAAAPGLLGATLLPKVNVGHTEVNVVKQPYTVQQHEYIQRDVPVPVPVVRHEVVQPVIQPHITQYAAPVVSNYAAAPYISSYAGAPTQYAAPVVSNYAAAPYISSYAGAPFVSTYAGVPAVKYF